MAKEFQVRVLVAEDEPFTLALVSEVLAAANFEVSAVATVTEAISTLEVFSLNVVVTDLNFGPGAPTGADLLAHIDEHYPWIGKWYLPRMDLLHWHYPWETIWTARSPIS